MRVGEFVPPDSKTYWKKTTTIIWYWQKNREIHQQNTVENPEDLFVYKKKYDQSNTSKEWGNNRTIGYVIFKKCSQIPASYHTKNKFSVD